jgi:alpha-galactosidase
LIVAVPRAKLTYLFFAAILTVWAPDPALSQSNTPPPNAPAVATLRHKTLEVLYNKHRLFNGELSIPAESLQYRTQVFRTGDKIQQVVLLTTLDGKIYGGSEAFPCEADRPGRGPLIVRHASGLSRSLRNRAVYDRQEDWALSVDALPNVQITPDETAAPGETFSIEIEGFEIALRFRPHFYQQHRGLRFFEPWTYSVWPHSVAGWISWFAFYDKVTESDITETADVFSEVLKPYGFDYFQMDDGYQQNNAAPDLWLNPNRKFPHGLDSLAHYIKGRGLKPGIWTSASFFDQTFAQEHAGWFVRDDSDRLARGSWIEYPVDASNPEALEKLVVPLYRGLREQGWEYFKVDALRHLRYEGYNANIGYFSRRSIDPVDAYRRYAETVRKEIGRDHFMLGCWGIRPELTGIIDGCRIGDDGFSYAGLAQYNSFNNIVWRNDPDHIELNEDAYRSTMVTSLTGSLMMLTDKPAIYRSSAVEPAKRTVPVLFTRPGQIYDVDPSRSENLSRVDAEVSGSGPRAFDAGYTPACFLYLLEINRPFDSWCVLGRTGGDIPEIRFSDLGLDPTREYLVFEFWGKRMLGTFSGGFTPGQIEAKFRSQAFCIRERQLHPQLVATSRHITCGGVDLSALSWDGRRLSGESDLVAHDAYTLYLTEPRGYRFETIECASLRPAKIEREGILVKATFQPETSGKAGWSALFSTSGH